MPCCDALSSGQAVKNSCCSVKLIEEATVDRYLRKYLRLFRLMYISLSASQMVLMVKNGPANAGDVRDAGLISGSGRSPRGGHSNLHQYCCLENPMDKGAWWAIVHSFAKSQT